MDIELKYDKGGVSGVYDLVNIGVKVDIASKQITLTFPIITGDYEDWYISLTNDLTDVELKFDSFGQSMDFDGLKLVGRHLMKNVDKSGTETAKFNVVLEYTE